jgi:hypothetical protein
MGKPTQLRWCLTYQCQALGVVGQVGTLHWVGARVLVHALAPGVFSTAYDCRQQSNYHSNRVDDLGAEGVR